MVLSRSGNSRSMFTRQGNGSSYNYKASSQYVTGLIDDSHYSPSELSQDLMLYHHNYPSKIPLNVFNVSSTDILGKLQILCIQ